MLQSMGSQRGGRPLATEQQQQHISFCSLIVEDSEGDFLAFKGNRDDKDFKWNLDTILENALKLLHMESSKLKVWKGRVVEHRTCGIEHLLGSSRAAMDTDSEQQSVSSGSWNSLHSDGSGKCYQPGFVSEPKLRCEK